MITRALLPRLKLWHQNPRRKPLVLNGARQVGKTTLLQMFGAAEFAHTCTINFDERQDYQQVFEPDLQPHRIISELAALTHQNISPEDTLIIFDEVQLCPRALTSLKYFCEQAPEYAIVAAGSNLGLLLHSGTGYPVGKVEHLNLCPLTFVEFLNALGKTQLAAIAQTGSPREYEILKTEFVQLLRLYLVVGGMPEAVATYLRTEDLLAVRQVQLDLLESYLRDVNKHAAVFEREPIISVWKALPEFLSRENKKFIFGQITPGKRARDFAGAITWLREAGYIGIVGRVTKPGLPLAGYEKANQFKVFALDVGLLGALAGLDTATVVSGSPLFTEFKGALTEQYVCQQLLYLDDAWPHYWSAENSSGEIDFLRQTSGQIYAVEVKAAENLQAKSLKNFCQKYPAVKAVRLSLSDYRTEENLTNIPLFALHNQELWPHTQTDNTVANPAGLYL